MRKKVLPPLGIYVHIPFCESKCIYCDFASFVCCEKANYFKKLNEEITSSPQKGRKVETIYIGGGTPSFVEQKYITKLLQSIRENYLVDKNCEITIECNPNTTTEEKLIAYKNSGVNRISFGVQSLDDEQLKFIGRKHNALQALQAVQKAKEVGFENISADLIIGLPNSTKEKLESFAVQLIKSGVKHISSYMLQVEEGTLLFELVKKKPQLLPSDETTIDMFENLVKIMEANSFNQYEVSNFAIKGYESKHNLKYWKGEDYLGFGLSATGTIGLKRKTNSSIMQGYLNGETFTETLNKQDKIKERLMLGLRCQEGVDLNALNCLGCNLENSDSLKEFIKKGIIIKKDNTIYLNKQYYPVNNQIIVKFFNEL